MSDRDYFAHYRAEPAAPAALYGPVDSRLDRQRVLIVARVPPLAAGTDAAQRASLVQQLQTALQAAPEAGLERTESVADGHVRLTAYHRLPHHAMYALVANAHEDFFAWWRRQAWWTAAFLLVFIATTIALERTLTHRHRLLQRAQALYDEAPCGYHTLDAQGRYVSINATELRWLGCTRDEVVGQLGLKDFLTDAGRAVFDDRFACLKAGERADGVELDLVGRDGSVRRVAVHATPVRGRDGTFALSNTTLHDISALKQAEAERLRGVELQAQNQALRQSARVKDEFLATLSHELRTPLNGVISFAHVLRGTAAGQDETKRRRYLGLIEDSGRHLLALIDSMLDMARVQSGRMAFSPQPVEVPAALQEVVDMLLSQQQRAQVDVQLQVGPGLQRVVADPLRLRQMVLNLVGNAIRFSHAGTQVQVVASVVDHARWQVQVSDQGIGIAPADHERIFSAFVQVDGSFNRPYEGAGLGLALVRQIARAQGGEVSVRSELGQGAVFTLVLPRVLAAGPG